MSVAIKCSHCGKALKVPDDRIGKLAKCPACGETFTVLPANSVVGGKAGKVGEAKFGEHAAIAIPTGLLVWIGVGIFAIVVGGGIVLGPLRTWHQWEALEPHAQAVAQDVIIRGLQSYQSHLPWFNPKKDNYNAGVRQMAFTFMPYNITMPEKVVFAGVSTQGNFTGTYYPHTGEVDVNAEVGAVTFEGLTQDRTKAKGAIHITGREPDGQLSVEVNGQNATVVAPSLTP